MGKYDAFIAGQLHKGRAALGSELAQALVTNFHIGADNARKIIQRASEGGVIKSSKPLSFGKGQYLYVQPGLSFGKTLIREVSAKHRKPLYRLLELLHTNKVISFYEGLKVFSSPEEKTSSKVSLLIDVIDDLEKLKLIATAKDKQENHYIIGTDKGDPGIHDLYEILVEQHYHAMQLDTMFIPDVLRWMKELNLIDIGMTYRNILFPANGVKHNNLFWDAYAYTKTTGVNTSRASEAYGVDKQTLVTIDIVISRKYLQVDLDGYLARIQINLNSAKMNKRKVMPVVVYHEIEEITLNRMRKLGFLALDIKNIYGKNISSVLDKVLDMYTGQHENDLNHSIETALESIENSGHAQQLRTLRGVLFEALMRPVIKRSYPDSQTIPGRRLTDPKTKKSREFDLIVISSHPREILLVELKGLTGKSVVNVGTPDIKDTLRYFLRGSMPIAKNFYKDDKALQGHKITAAYITTGGFHPEASEFILKLASSEIKPSKIDMFYDGQTLEKYLLENGFEHENRIIRKFFLQQHLVADLFDVGDMP